MPQLSDLYDADQRTTDPVVADLAATKTIPHPLNNVQYADGISRCRHGKTHGPFEVCRQEVRVSPSAAVPAVQAQPAELELRRIVANLEAALKYMAATGSCVDLIDAAKDAISHQKDPA